MIPEPYFSMYDPADVVEPSNFGPIAPTLAALCGLPEDNWAGRDLMAGDLGKVD